MDKDHLFLAAEGWKNGKTSYFISTTLGIPEHVLMRHIEAIKELAKQ